MFSQNNLEKISKQIVASGETVTAQSIVTVLNGGIKNAVGLAGNDLAKGTAFVFENGITYVSTVALSSTKALVAYQDVDNSAYGTAIILNISGNVITSGSAYVFETGSTSYISATGLSSTKVLVAYNDGGNSSYGTSIILNVSVDVITSGTAFVFESAASVYFSASTLTSTKVLVAYTDQGNSSYGTSIVLNIDTDTITSGDAFVFESATTYYISLEKLTSTKALVVYKDVVNGNYGTSIVLNISNNTITSGTSFVFSSVSSSSFSVVALTDTKLIVAYWDTVTTFGTSIILNVSVDTISSGTAFVFESARADYNSIKKLTETKALVAYRDVGNSDYGTSVILNISENTITKGTALIFISSSLTQISFGALNSTKGVVCFRDEGNLYYGTSVVLDVSIIPPENIIGIAKQSGVAGSVVDISYGKEIGGFTGLTQGAVYYLGDDATLNTSGTTKVAIALSTTKVKWLKAKI